MTNIPESASDRREFFRMDFRQPVKFREFQRDESGPKLGTSENISQSGLLFKTRIVPPLSSILWMDVDIRTLRICQEIENRALVQDDGLLGRVVRVEEDPDETNTYNVGVCFLRKSDTTQIPSRQSYPGRPA